MIESGKKIPYQSGLLAKAKIANMMADSINQNKNLLFDQQVFSQTITPAGRLITINPIIITGDILNFTCTLNDKTVEVRSGTVRLHGIGNYRVETETDIAGRVILSGDPDWVFVYHYRDHSLTGIDHSATEPVSDTNILRVPLAKYKLTDSGMYYLSETCYRGDVQIDAPLR